MITVAIILTSVFLNAQIQYHSFLGKTKNDIKSSMSKDFHDYKSNDMGVSASDNTLRYYNAKKDVTLIYYFNEKEECKHVKVLEDIETLEKRILEFNQTYQKNGTIKWKTVLNGKLVAIELIKDEYNYSVIYHY
jgi:hypothetical protein